MEIESSKDKIQCTDVATVVWLGGSIPEQGTMDAIEQLFLELIVFTSNQLDQL